MLSGCAAPSPTTPKVRRIGYLSGNFSVGVLGNVDLIKETLRERGYVRQRDFVVDIRVAEGNNERLPAMAADLITLPVDVLLAEATPAVLAAKQATSAIPIVFLLVNDPVGQGMVTSLARPGANITGVSTLSGALSGKRLELLKESVPGLARLAVLWNANNPGQELVLHDTEDAARALGLALQAHGIHSAAELDVALEAIARQRPDALVVLPAFSYPQRVVDFATNSRLPHMFSQAPPAATGGGLMAFGPDYPAQTRRAAGLVDAILKGARPADLPVEQPTQFVFVVNLVTAQTIGMTIPESVVRQATELVR